MQIPGVIRCAAPVVVVAVLAGCGGGAAKQPEFTAARTMPPLAVPPDLLPATGSGSMQVPEPEPESEPAPAVETPVVRGRAAESGGMDVSMIRTPEGAPAMTVAGSFERVWPRIGQSLVDLGVKVDGQDRNMGVYYVRYSDPDARKKAGLLKRWFRRAELDRHQVVIASEGDKSLVTILDRNGKLDKSSASRNLLSVLSEHLQ